MISDFFVDRRFQCCNEEEDHSKSSLRDFFVVLALTFHAILEGIAVGLEPEVNDVWLLFAGKVLDPDVYYITFDYKGSII